MGKLIEMGWKIDPVGKKINDRLAQSSVLQPIVDPFNVSAPVKAKERDRNEAADKVRRDTDEIFRLQFSTDEDREAALRTDFGNRNFLGVTNSDG
jgi:hypothetical protein